MPMCQASEEFSGKAYYQAVGNDCYKSDFFGVGGTFDIYNNYPTCDITPSSTATSLSNHNIVDGPHLSSLNQQDLV